MVYVFLANGFEDIEALAPVDLMRRAGIEVKTVGVGGSNITTSHRVTVKTDMTINELVFGSDLEMIVLPGGMPGTLNLENDMELQHTIDYCVENDKFIGAICAAPSILGHKGLLEGKKATCYPGFEKDLLGAEFTGEKVVQDGKIITSRGAGACLEFGLKLVEALKGKEKSDEIADNIRY